MTHIFCLLDLESAGSAADLDSWMAESSLESVHLSKTSQHVSVSESRMERAYAAYADEPLTSSVDTLESSVSMLSHVFRYTAE